MRIIHTADIHLDSKMGKLPREEAKRRRDEIVDTFKNMIDFASREGVDAILISGDLFDTNNVSNLYQNLVKDVIVSNPHILFFYLKGNHDNNSFLSCLDEIPENLMLFDEDWTSYDLGNGIVITGIELTPDNSRVMSDSLLLEAEKLNIVMLHGQDSQYRSGDKAEVIAISDLKNKGIDYLALGHVHARKIEALDSRGKYCYPGCLEGRGFDECGEKGFMLLDIDEDSLRITPSFVPFARRTIYELPVDVRGAKTSYDAERIIDGYISDSDLSKDSLVRLVLVGQVPMDSDIDTGYLTTHFKDAFYYIEIIDGTSFSVDYDSYEFDESLKGEFVRVVKADTDLTEEEKALIIKTGIDLLRDNK